MTSEKESGWQKAVIATLISTVLSPIGVSLGWYLGHVLARPQLQIEYIEPIYVVDPPSPRQDIIDSLAKNRQLTTRFRDILARNGASLECRRWLDGAAWSNDCLSVVSDSATGLHNMLLAMSEALGTNVSILQKWNPPEKPGDLVLVPGLEMMQMITSVKPMLTMIDKDSALSNARSMLKMVNQMLQGIDPVIKEVDGLASTDGTRTGDIQLDVGLLNAGDSDGVARPKAVLEIDGVRVSLEARDDSGSPIYAVVKAHSLVSTNFVLVLGDDEREARERLRALVKAGKPQDFELQVTTTDGKTLKRTARLER